MLVDNATPPPRKINVNNETQQKNQATDIPQKQNETVGGKDDFYPGIVRAHSLWVENIRYLHDYKDGFQNGDKDFLLQLVREGKALFVENSAGAVCSGTHEDGKIIQIRFFEGRYKNKKGYIFADFVQKLEK